MIYCTTLGTVLYKKVHSDLQAVHGGSRTVHKGSWTVHKCLFAHT